MKIATTNLCRALVALLLFIAAAPVNAQSEQPLFNRTEAMIPNRGSQVFGITLQSLVANK